MTIDPRHLAEFRSLAYALTRDEENARDLFQEAIYLILKNAHSFQAGTNFLAWSKTIIRNTFISGYRQKKRRNELLERDRPSLPWFNRLVQENPAESDLNIEEIMELVEALPEINRKSFQLFLAGKKYREIAAITGSPEGTAKSRVHHARQILQKQIRLRGNIDG